MYSKGIGVAVDYNKALGFERLAAQQGYSRAESDLAYFYETGKGVPLDYVMAYAWYSRAIAGGDTVASNRRKSLARLITPKQLREANALVSQLSAH